MSEGFGLVGWLMGSAVLDFLFFWILWGFLEMFREILWGFLENFEEFFGDLFGLFLFFLFF